jgi:glycine/D-amino acid oxidase-like deaminating enzyme
VPVESWDVETDVVVVGFGAAGACAALEAAEAGADVVVLDRFFRRWFGTYGPARPPRQEKRSGWWTGLLTAGGFLAALAVLLGLKRRRDRREEKSSYGSESYYTYSEYTSESEYYILPTTGDWDSPS